MQKRLFYFIPLVLFIVLAGWLVAHTSLFSPRPQFELIDKPIPEFTTPALTNGEAGVSSADFTGKVIILNFFASWCIPCKAEHPQIMRLAKLNLAPVYGIAYRDKADLALEWLNELGNPYQQSGLDEFGKAGRSWNFRGIPVTYVIDADGRLRYQFSGMISKRALEREVIPAIKFLTK